MHLHPKHFQEFVQRTQSHRAQGNVGRSVRRWAQSIGAPDAVVSELGDTAIDRHALRAYCSDPRHGTVAVFCSVMAWGGMRADHGRAALVESGAWAPVLSRIRTDATLDRNAAYRLLADLRRAGHLPGTRPAFFTKLIFFLQPTARGYIMDQWTAKSVNLLMDEPIVDLNPYGFVTDENTAETYDAFCRAIEHVAEQWPSPSKPNPEQIEEWMMSAGGRNPAPWREYVVAETGRRKGNDAVGSE